MRDMVGCFSEHAIRLSETTCSSQIHNQNYQQQQHQSSPISHHHHHLLKPTTSPSTQITVTSQYNLTLTNKTNLLLTLTWSRNQINHQSLTITFSSNNNNNPSSSIKLTTNASRLFRKKKGTRSIELSDTTKIDLLWDLSEANYESSSSSGGGGGGVEPVSGYYLIVLVDSEVGLMLGDLCEEVSSKRLMMMKNGNGRMRLKCGLISRKEYYTGESLYTTMKRVKFSECGEMHEIEIRCVGEDEGLKYPILIVSVDGRVVVRVKRLRWNFRGNQTVFVDGLLIDLFWDVHGWFFSRNNGCGVFMFRRRCGIESRLWMHQEEDDKILKGGDDSGDDQFSLLVYASKVM